MRVLLLGGGTSPERPVSLRSARAIEAALDELRIPVIFADTENGYDFLDGVASDTIVLPILHGAGGEDGEVQRELEKRKLPFLGADSESSAICFDKWETRLVLQDSAIPVAEGELVTRETYANSNLRNQPHVLKAVGGGSSIGTMLVRNPNEVTDNKIEEVFAVSDKAVIEELIEGVEITVPILDQTALPVIEIRPPEDGEFDYENKYNGQTQELCPPELVSETIQKEAQDLAVRVHQVTGCRHFSRVDLIVRPDGSLVVLEINTIPGMTDQSLFPKSAATAGMTFPELVNQLVGFVIRDYGLETV